MEILLWLVPSAVVTVVAMGWVTWAGRQRPREVDRDAAVARLGEAIRKDLPGSATPRAGTRDRSTGIAVRPSRRTVPEPVDDIRTRRGA